MAQPVRQVGIRAPGFEGLNTELSPINGDPEFALVADNVVVDQIGRLSSRKAFVKETDIGGNFIPNDLDHPLRDFAGWSVKPHAFLCFIPFGSSDENVYYEPSQDETWIMLQEWANQGQGNGEIDFWNGTTVPEITAPKLTDWSSFANPDGFSNPIWIMSLPVAWRTEPRESTGVTWIATQNGTEIGRYYSLDEDRYNVRFIVKNPDIPIKIRIEPDAGLVQQHGEKLDLGKARIAKADLFVANGDEEEKIYNEIITLGKDVQGTSPVQSQDIQVPVMIYRYGSGYEFPSDTRTVPVGMKRERAVRASLPEITGPLTYGVCSVTESGVVDHILPDGYDYSPYLLTGNFVNFSAENLTTGNDRLLLFCKGKPFLRLDNHDEWVVAGGEWTDGNGTTHPIDGDIAISAYGRVWVAGVGGDYHQIHYSKLLDETVWYDETADYDGFNDAGIIDVREYWPVDGDSIVNIHAHNGYLLVFGRNSILIYANADAGNPAGIFNQPDSGIFLQDAIANVGLVRRDAICNVGTDVLFVDDSGVRSLGRVVQEKSNPLQEPSLNIRRELQEVIQTEVLESPSHSAIRFKHFPSESIAVLLFSSLKIAYVFHLNMPSKTGGMKVTRWTDCTWNDSIELKTAQEDVVYLAGKPSKGLMKYDGYLETSSTGAVKPYVMRYESMALAIGQSPMQTTIPKSIHYVCMGEFVPGQANGLWGFSDRFVGSREFQIEVDGGGSNYAVNEFGSSSQDQDGNVVGGPTDLAGYYPMGGPYYKGYKINTTGSGELFRVGFEVKVQGGRYALQEIDINSAIGRLTA